MDFIKIRFTKNFETLDSNSEENVEDFFRSIQPIFSLSERKWKPLMDMYETDAEIIVVIDIGGVEKESIQIELSSKALRIFGSRSGPKIPNARYRLAEIQYGKFERIVFFPAPIDPEVVSAAYTDGFLQIRMARLNTNKTHRLSITGE